jgi:membrane-bound lytic murein transglycosylase MltF
VRVHAWANRALVVEVARRVEAMTRMLGKRNAPVLWVVLSADSGGFVRWHDAARSRDGARGLMSLYREKDQFGRAWRVVRYVPAVALGRKR